MSWNFPFYDGEWKSFVEGRINFLKGEAERIWKRMPEVSQQYPGAGANLNGFGIPNPENPGGGEQAKPWRIGVVQGNYYLDPTTTGMSVTWQYGTGTQGSETGDGNNKTAFFRNINGRAFLKDQDKVKATWNGVAWELEQFQACLFFIGKTKASVAKASAVGVDPWYFDGSSHAVQPSPSTPIEVYFMPAAVQADKWVHCSYDIVTRKWYGVAAECNGVAL